MINTVCTHVCYNDKVHIKVDFDDVTNKPDLVTRDEIVTEFKTINGQEITGTGNIEISGGSGETIDTSNFATKDEVNTLSNNITNNYALKNEIPSLDGYAKTTDIPDTSNLATKDEIVKEFKTINGQEITGTGNIEISSNVDTSNFVTRDEMSNYTNRNSKEEISTQWNFQRGILEYGTSLNGRYMSIEQPFKTINGESIKGDGDIVISGGSGDIDTSNFVTINEMLKYPNRNSNEEIYAQWNFTSGILEEGLPLSVLYMSTSQPFKTINGEPILGEGDIAISGGSGASLAVKNGTGYSIQFITKLNYAHLQVSGTIDSHCLYVITD